MLIPLLRYADHEGRECEVWLVQHQQEQPPRIVARPCADARCVPSIDIELHRLFGPALRAGPIRQMIGDGPGYAEIPADRVRQAAELAFRHLPRTAGSFRVVWMPDDLGVAC